MENAGILITVDMLVSFFTTTSIILGAIWKLYKPLKDQLARIDKLERWTERQQKDIAASRAESTVMMTAVLSCLEGIKNNENNGSVTDSIKMIKTFIVQQATRGSSYDIDKK